jgi:hypothetical protein
MTLLPKLAICSFVFVLGAIGFWNFPRELTVRLTDGYVGWILLIPSDNVVKFNGYEFEPDKKGICLINSDLIKDPFRLRVIQNGQSIESYAKYMGLTVRHDDKRNCDFKYIQLYIPSPQLWKLPDYDQHWMHESFSLNEMKQQLIDSLKEEGAIKPYK